MAETDPPTSDPAPHPRRHLVTSRRSVSARKRAAPAPHAPNPPKNDVPPAHPDEATPAAEEPGHGEKAGHGEEPGPEGEAGNEGHDGGDDGGDDGEKGREPLTLGTRLLRALAVWALLLAVTTPMGYFFERHTEEGKKRLDHANQVVAEVLRHAQPAAVAVRFYTRLLQDRGLALYQWGAPMNAAVAREDLAKKYPRLTLICGASRLFRAQTDFTGPDGTPCRLVAPEDPPATPPAEGLLSLRSLTLFPANFDNPPTQPHAWTVLKKESDLERAREAEQQEAKDPMAAAAQAQRAADAADRAAYVAGLARIDRLVLLPFQPPPGSDPMATGRGDAYTTLYTVVLGLPDAYLDLIHGLWPHSAAAVAVVAVALAFLAALMVGQANAWRTLAFLLLVPVAVSLVAGLLSLASWGVYALGHLSWSSLSVTVSAAITSFWSSATPEVVKHQAFEAVKKVLGRRFAVFAEE